MREFVDAHPRDGIPDPIAALPLVHVVDLMADPARNGQRTDKERIGTAWNGFGTPGRRGGTFSGFSFQIRSVPVPVLCPFRPFFVRSFSVPMSVPGIFWALGPKNGNGFSSVPFPFPFPFFVSSRSRSAHLCWVVHPVFNTSHLILRYSRSVEFSGRRSHLRL